MKSVSILMPTYNSAQVIAGCLESIGRQRYPKELIELIIADGGSADRTLSLVRAFAENNPELKVIIVPNPLITGEAGKAAALKRAGGEIIALIDSDNILPSEDWLRRMLQPFENAQITAAEPIGYTHRKEDGYITRYCALMGMNDPLCYFLGSYDRYNYISKTWTGYAMQWEERGDWLELTFRPGEPIPTIGANGFCIRRRELLKIMQKDKIPLTLTLSPEGRGGIKDYLFDIDILPELIGSSDMPVKVAKVKTDIVHIFSGDIGKFAKKQNRRVKDYLFFSRQKNRIYPWQMKRKSGRILKFILYCLLLIPLCIQMIKGYLNKPDTAWFFHPAACWITLAVYGWGMTVGRIRAGIADRSNWKG